jgi:hypothetical protein
VEILLLGVAYYAIGPSGRPDLGVPVAALGVLVLVLLFTARSRAWAMGEDPSSRPNGPERRR